MVPVPLTIPAAGWLTVMGLVFGWLRVKSGSVYPGMLVHAAWNSWVIWSEL
jgi:membrane protease YdiL (CAAX protease family)